MLAHSNKTIPLVFINKTGIQYLKLIFVLNEICPALKFKIKLLSTAGVCILIRLITELPQQYSQYVIVIDIYVVMLFLYRTTLRLQLKLQLLNKKLIMWQYT